MRWQTESRGISNVWAGLAIMMGVSLWFGPTPQSASAAESPKDAKPAAAAASKGESLFDGKTLNGWKAPQFGGEGKVYVKDGAIILERGDTMTGITYTGKVPTVDYELSFEGKRVDGSDFFATATFPVGNSHCSFVLGGWGGSVVGLSSIDHADASENETTQFKSFKTNQWYRIRVRVTKEKIECWIDDEKTVDLRYVSWEDDNGKKVKRERKISIRIECDLCRPLGISAWCTTGAVRNIRIRSLNEAETKPAADR